MNSLEADLDRARGLAVDELAAAIESIGFECTRCGACCKAATCDGDAEGEENSAEDESGQASSEPHTATVFPDEIRDLMEAGDYDWRDVARPMPYGLEEDQDGKHGTTFEWALQTDDCGDCTFYEEPTDGTAGTCTVYDDRPLICETYPFSIALGGTSQPMGEAVDEAGMVRAHECEGLGRDIDSERARELAATLKERAIRELEEAIDLREAYEPTSGEAGVTVYDSEGPKRPDGTPVDDE